MFIRAFSADSKESTKRNDEKQNQAQQGDLDDFIFMDQENHCSER